MSINFTINILIPTKNYDSEDLNEEDQRFLSLTNLEYLLRKNKNQSRLKKIRREMQKSKLTEEKSDRDAKAMKQIGKNLKN